MVLKETEDIYKRSEMLFLRHPGLQPRMRAILLDWLNEVIVFENLLLGISFCKYFIL